MTIQVDLIALQPDAGGGVLLPAGTARRGGSHAWPRVEKPVHGNSSKCFMDLRRRPASLNMF
jgi:hypothetical protein